MKRAILIHGPSGVGKSTIAKMIAEKYKFNHCDADEFKLIFSPKRSAERTKIGEMTCYFYTKELIRRGKSVIVEALPDKYLRQLTNVMKRSHYKIIEISLVAPLKQCINNDATRTKKKYGKKVISDVYEELNFKRGYVINATDKSPSQVFQIVKKIISKPI